jgi:hypothetical protein
MSDSHAAGRGQEAPTSGGSDGRHTIDLTNAWESPAADRAPAQDCGPETSAAWARSFGLPTGLSSGDRVWLVLDAGRDCRLILNGSPLPPVVGSCRYAVDVTALLVPRNRLWLLPAAGESLVPTEASKSLPPHGRCPLPAVYGRVRLEIETVAVGGAAHETPAGA